ncbi:MAG TPA: MBL fold metallo-hydrolase [Chitinophagaceae bacterium]|jgi:metallo-beta-lactamase family protein|nr:MBL fold metallo-hydrolase [Chitinophagaceae bacterium]
MKLAFHGAARVVTGSKHLLTLDNGKKYLLDCGMFQGMGRDTDNMNREWGFNPREIDCLILSHAHIDHTGLIPKLYKDGFRGLIYCTPGTKALTEILLEDSAQIQEEDTRFANKHRLAEGHPPQQPLFKRHDAAEAMKLFKEVEYGTSYKIDEHIEVLFTDTGHIIGSAAVHLKIHEPGKTILLTFSGDVGRYNDMILRPPQDFPQADYILLESTYGDKLHDVEITTPDNLLNWINRTCLTKKGKLIIPAFSVGRTQELLFALNQLEIENRLPALDYFVDSPMSIEVTEVVKRFPDYFNEAIQKLLISDKDPFAFRGLKYIKTVEESKQLNYRKGPFVIIAASGMADSGRVKHHISNNIENSRNTVLMVGYAERNSLGGRLLAGEKEVRIFGVEHEVHAEVGSVRSMSAHGDYEDLCRFILHQDPAKLRSIFLVHGDYDTQLAFRETLLKRGFSQVEIPDLHQELILK